VRVAYVSRPSYLDHVLPEVEALSRLVELHLFIELVPELWKSSLFDAPSRVLPSGVIPGDPVFRELFPPGVRRYWEGCASFSLVVHNCGKTFHPASWWVSHRAASRIRSLQPDVLHLDEISPRLALAIPELRKLPIVLAIHDPAIHPGEADWRGLLARRVAFRWVRRFILHSASFREFFAETHKVPLEHIETVPLGVLDIFREWSDGPLHTDEKVVLFFGRLSPYKGLEVLYEAAPMIAERVENVRFIVAGKPVPGYRLPAPPRLPNNGHVEVMENYMTNRELASLFQRASVVVCPYVQATQSGVVLTAYAFEKPVVATRTGGLPEYVHDGETGILVPPGDPHALSRALEKILKDKNLALKFSAGIRRMRDGSLSWGSIAEQTVRVYESLFRPGE
jgi:glycosyltransferase involved in cell wall biosynthesis